LRLLVVDRNGVQYLLLGTHISPRKNDTTIFFTTNYYHFSTTADMKKACAPTCHTCDYLSIESRCPLDPNAPDAWGPGDLDKTFVKLTQEPYLSEYEVKVLSSPPDGPWVLTMENIVSAEEAERLIELGGVEGYTQSQNTGKVLPTGETERLNSTTRTSMNAW
jgi:prolyl 4-hydroxylase